jgi:hypothetical protein
MVPFLWKKNVLKSGTRISCHFAGTLLAFSADFFYGLLCSSLLYIQIHKEKEM